MGFHQGIRKVNKHSYHSTPALQAAHAYNTFRNTYVITFQTCQESFFPTSTGRTTTNYPTFLNNLNSNAAFGQLLQSKIKLTLYS